MKKLYTITRWFYYFVYHQLFWLSVTSLAVNANSTTYYVSPSGDDNNPGTEESPFKTIQKAVDLANVQVPPYM
jgi:hypothetical protein